MQVYQVCLTLALQFKQYTDRGFGYPNPLLYFPLVEMNH
jgi:hypothetical protein